MVVSDPFPPPLRCLHLSARARIDFDEERGFSMTPEEVRSKWPRFFGECPDCGTSCIIYASLAHYVAGDW